MNTSVQLLQSLLAPHEYRAVADFLGQIRARYQERVAQAILFGSKARGDAAPESDIDILIIVDHDDWRLSHTFSTMAARVSLEHDALIGLYVIGQERWNQMAQRRLGLYRNVVAEGIILPT